MSLRPKQLMWIDGTEACDILQERNYFNRSVAINIKFMAQIMK